jgi:hypothetical protein
MMRCRSGKTFDSYDPPGSHINGGHIYAAKPTDGYSAVNLRGRWMTSIGFTGTRQGMTAEQKSALRNLLDGGAGDFHHGDCIGADSEAHGIAWV